jgi:hypothetical protein
MRTVLRLENGLRLADELGRPERSKSGNRWEL